MIVALFLMLTIVAVTLGPVSALIMLVGVLVVRYLRTLTHDWWEQ